MLDVDAMTHHSRLALALAAALSGEEYRWFGPDRMVYIVQVTPESLAEAPTPCPCEGCDLTYGGMR